nr:hypothetical protein [uncultured Sphaerochaeta sp.]
METPELQKAVYEWAYKKGAYPCLEVTMPEGDRVDMLTYKKRNDTFTCYEFKVSKSDIHSKHALTFVGDHNYICVPDSLAEEAETVVEPHVGIIAVTDYLFCHVTRKSKRVEPKDHAVLMFCLMRSLQGRYNKYKLYLPDGMREDARVNSLKKLVSNLKRGERESSKLHSRLQSLYRNIGYENHHLYETLSQDNYYPNIDGVSEEFRAACTKENEQIRREVSTWRKTTCGLT